jgi:hypothetical protein
MKRDLSPYFYYVLAIFLYLGCIPQINGQSIPSFREDEQRLDQLIKSRDLKGLLDAASDVEAKYSTDVRAYSQWLANVAPACSSYDFGDKKQYLYPDVFAKKYLIGPKVSPLISKGTWCPIYKEI